jgi:hypothetical protein
MMPFADLLPKKKKKAPRGLATPPVSVPAYRPPVNAPGHPVPARLARKLKALGGRFRLIRSGERLAQYVTVALVLLAFQMLLDWLVDLDWPVRALFLGGDIWLLVHFARRHRLARLLHVPNPEACALMVEKHWPRLRGRVIATVQFAAPSFIAAPPALVEALQRETDVGTGAYDFGQIVPVRELKRRGGMALGVLTLWLGLLVVLAPGSFALLMRVFLLPASVPRKTEVICLSGSKVIPAGESVLLEARAKGIVPSHGRVTLVDDNGRVQDITLDPEPHRPDVFGLSIAKVEAPFTYTIRLNDGSSDSYRIKTVPRPDVTSIDCVQIYPAYTGLDPIKRTVGNLALLAGSRLQIHAVANSKIVKATVKLAGPGQVIPLQIGGAEGDELTGEIPIPAAGLTGFSIQMVNEAAITSGDGTEYRIDIIPDRAPTVEVTYPERLQELYTLKAKPTIAFSASDDYGLAQITLCYRVIQDNSDTTGDTSPAPVASARRIEMDLGAEHPLTSQRRYVWDLAAVRPALTEGETLEYWMEARDGNIVTGPDIGESEHRTIKVVSDIEKKAEIMNRLMDSLSTVTDISQNQEKINQDLGAVIQGKPATAK